MAAAFTGGTFLTQREALHANQSAAVQAQRAALFSQFQQQYNAVSANFPDKFADAKFRPALGTEDYARLQAYWIFCFSEWYATHRVSPKAFGDLWSDYYAPLIANGLRIPSLKYVLEDRVRAHGAGSGAWNAFLRDIDKLASAHRVPLDSEVHALISGTKVAQSGETGVSFASQKAPRDP
ncbi:MAG: hypothetical protein V4444_05300 [Pseudomonadota bacterium]